MSGVKHPEITHFWKGDVKPVKDLKTVFRLVFHMTSESSPLPRTIFRAYDIRGIFGKDLTLDLAYKIGRAFATKMGFGRKICMSKDTRVSSSALMESFALGLLDSGCVSLKFDTIPVPVLGYCIWSQNFDAGIYISASHNPPEYNGIRFRDGDGSGMYYRDLNLEEVIEHNQFRELDEQEKREVYTVNGDIEPVIQEYCEFVSHRIQLENAVKIVLDPGNGSAYRMMPLYQNIGCDVFGINMVPDGRFPNRMPEPKKETLGKTLKFVRNSGADFGVAFDADSDRGIIIDERGDIVSPEKIAVILAKEISEKGTVVASMDCSFLLERELENLGYRIVRERVGDVFISKAVQRNRAIIGVERSGHFFIPEFHASDDPFVMSSVLAEVLSKERRSLSQIAGEIQDYPYRSEAIFCPDDVKFEVMERIKDRILRNEEWNVELKDGIRIFTEDWAVLIRASHTEPKIRLYAETAVENLSELFKGFREIVVENIRATS